MDELQKLINGRRFNDYQPGLSARFLASGIDYHFEYETIHAIHSLKVYINSGKKKVIIEIWENGNLYCSYFTEGVWINERFKNCNEHDFHTMLAHAFLNLRDGNFKHGRKANHEL